jgi:hypothetical protein
VQLWAYENGPGQAASPPADWPRDSTLPAPNGRSTLVLLMHPQCSCSRATVAELARLEARVGGRLDTYVLILSPEGMPAEWTHSSFWKAAAAIDGVRVIADAGGVEARRFGAATSGQALLYDRHGRLRFNGGITVSRGHEGDNDGRTAVEQLVANERAEHASTLVYGCALQ